MGGPHPEADAGGGGCSVSRAPGVGEKSGVQSAGGQRLEGQRKKPRPDGEGLVQGPRSEWWSRTCSAPTEEQPARAPTSGARERWSHREDLQGLLTGGCKRLWAQAAGSPAWLSRDSGARRAAPATATWPWIINTDPQVSLQSPAERKQARVTPAPQPQTAHLPYRGTTCPERVPTCPSRGPESQLHWALSTSRTGATGRTRPASPHSH